MLRNIDIELRAYKQGARWPLLYLLRPVYAMGGAQRRGRPWEALPMPGHSMRNAP